MAATLKALAGDRFKPFDVVTAMHATVKPMDVVLDRYVFLPHARFGIAAALSTPFDWGLPVRARIDVQVPVADDRGAIDAEMTVHVHGPASVLEVDPRQVIRTHPKADVVDAEVDDLAHIEFDRPDLPWLFTPAGPDAQGRLVPWLTLVVAERRYVDFGTRRGTVRIARIRRDQLQPLHDAWAWAHAQVAGAKGAAATDAPTLEQRLGESNAAQNLSRLVCPRRLDDRTAYVGCVVPTFLAGAQAAQGLAPVSTLAPAWGTKDNFAGGDPFDWVTLPVFYEWQFGTGEAGNFESLARKLRPAVAPPGVGRRRVDATQPWPGLALGADATGAEMVVTGPVVSPQVPLTEPTEGPGDGEDATAAPWPEEAEQRWPEPVTADLIDRLNHADAQTDPPVVGPPLYGGRHARQPRIETQAAAAAGQPAWFRELNTDPRHRIVAALGTAVVQAEQEDLMLAAWNQVAGIEATNRALRLAQLARHVSTSLHRRHLSRLSDAALLAITDRVHPKVRDDATRSVWSSIQRSSLPSAVTTGAFRRLARVRGPVVASALRGQARRAPVGTPALAPGDVASLIDALTVRADRFTADWVHRYRLPDGIGGLSHLAQSAITDDLAATIAPGLDAASLVDRWRADLARPSAPDRLASTDLRRLPDPQAISASLSTALLVSLVDRVVGSFPDERELERDPAAALAGAAQLPLLRVLVEFAQSRQRNALPVRPTDLRRLRLLPLGRSDIPGRGLVEGEALIALGIQATEVARRHQLELPIADFGQAAARLRRLIADQLHVDGARVVQGLGEVRKKVVAGEAFVATPRDRVLAPGLALLGKLDPTVTVTARITGRFTGGSGRLPTWLRPDWFSDQRVEPVMACPRFHYPMYEPLHRYDREWMVPGLGLIKKPEMATLLVTNNRFIEGYLVGLNHEMARELLWRGFPTDQRGTCFDSFWTGEPELGADLHELPWRSGALGTHVKAELDGQMVLLVRGDLIRRYPGVVAHAVLEQGSDGGIPIFGATSPVRTLFRAFLSPNVLLVGFALTRARIATPGEKWWFTLSENPTEPRFGLDPAREEPLSRDSLVWSDFGVAEPGQFLDATRHTNLAFDGARWGASSASGAYLLFQLPARAAFSASRMVAGAMT